MTATKTNTMAAVFMTGGETPAAEQPAPAGEAEQPKQRRRRRSLIDKDPMPGASGAEMKKKIYNC